MIDSNFTEEIESVDESLVSHYSIRRSVSSPYLFTVVAMDSKNEGLYVVESDVTFEIAQKLVEDFNSTEETNLEGN